MPKPDEETDQNQPSGRIADLDLSGTSCPIAFVKTRLFLDQIPNGKEVRILYEDTSANEPLPRSIESLGHKIIAKTKSQSPVERTNNAASAISSPDRKLQAILLLIQVQK